MKHVPAKTVLQAVVAVDLVDLAANSVVAAVVAVMSAVVAVDMVVVAAAEAAANMAAVKS